MFWNSKASKNNEMRLSVDRAESALQACSAELAQALAAKAEAERECERLRARDKSFGNLFDRLRLYGESAVNVQGSLASLAQAMKDERDQSVRATS
ncbi:MAG: hypothetical protein H6952_00005, partial [Zoogloeaceae bacterium]|nr:hypothetical protein [Zoogloeaceae bacterium]